MSWDEIRDNLLCEVIHELRRLSEGKVPHVSTDIHHIWVNFENKGEKIGCLGLADALHALYEDVYLYEEFDLREAESISFETF